MISVILTALAFVLYLAASVGYGAVFFLNAPSAPVLMPQGVATATPPRPSRLSRPLLWAGILAQFAAIGVWCATTHRSPFASEYGTLSVLAWSLALAFAALDFRERVPALGALALLLACGTLFVAFVHSNGPIAETPVLSSRIVSLHVLSILASYALFLLAFGCGALYLWQNHTLKSRNVSGLFRRLPPLATLDALAYHAVAYALPLLTLGIVLGMVRLYGGGVGLTPFAWLIDSHTIASFATWGFYVFYLAARLGLGWRGVRLQYVLLVGLAVALTVYVLPTSTHKFQ